MKEQALEAKKRVHIHAHMYRCVDMYMCMVCMYVCMYLYACVRNIRHTVSLVLAHCHRNTPFTTEQGPKTVLEDEEDGASPSISN